MNGIHRIRILRHNIALPKGIKDGVFFLLVSLSPFFLYSPASAAVPPGDEPGAQASRFQSEAIGERQTVEKKKVKKPDIEVKEEETPAPAAKGPSFILKGLKVTGSTLFKDEEFLPVYESYLDKSVTFQDLDGIAKKITAKYKEKGYLTTTAYIPEQDIGAGKVEIKVAEGKVGDLTVEGNKWFTAPLVKKYIRVKKNELLNLFVLQRDLLQLNQNSDLEVKTVIAAGREPGTSDIVLKVKDKYPYHAGVSVDNQGTRLVGKWRDSFSFRSTNLTGRNDSVFFTTLMGKLSAGNFGSYAIPLNTTGLKLGMDFTVFTTKLGSEYKAQDITGISQMYTPHLTGDIYLSEDFQADVDSGLEIKSIKKFTQGNTTSNDQLRLPYMGFNFTKVDTIGGGGQTTFSPKFTFGTSHFLGASKFDHPTASRDGTGGFFFKYEQTIRRTQRMPQESYISIRSQFQTTSATLPSSEQFQIGGMSTVRGYPEGEYIADIGASLNVDWFFPCYLFPKDYKLPYAEAPLRQQIQPVIFMDLAGGKLKRAFPGERPIRFLMGLGGGLKIQYNRNVFLRLEWAGRVGDRPGGGQGPSNFHMSFQLEV